MWDLSFCCKKISTGHMVDLQFRQLVRVDFKPSMPKAKLNAFHPCIFLLLAIFPPIASGLIAISSGLRATKWSVAVLVLTEQYLHVGQLSVQYSLRSSPAQCLILVLTPHFYCFHMVRVFAWAFPTLWHHAAKLDSWPRRSPIVSRDTIVSSNRTSISLLSHTSSIPFSTSISLPTSGRVNNTFSLTIFSSD